MAKRSALQTVAVGLRLMQTSPLETVAAGLRGLTLDELEQFARLVADEIVAARARAKNPAGRLEPSPADPALLHVVDRPDGVTYRQLLIRCGKDPCTCIKGLGHGPYWYACWHDNGRTRTRYVGKTFKEIKVPAARKRSGKGAAR